MKKQDAEKLVNDCFTKPYDETQFRGVVQQLFIDYESLDENAATGNHIPESFRDHIVSFKRLAKFMDPENREIDVLAVKLKTKGQLENARTLQRNFIARYLNGSRGGQLKDAALVAFYTDQSNDWRFSLIKMDYVLDAEQQKVKKELTPARRYSFLVGQNEKTHTARKQLLPVLVSETETTLSELESAFNIETVTKEFFTQYKTLYLRLKEALDKHIEKDSVVQKEFDSKGVKTGDFAKRLLGQIVFLYFLQKKGWLGVAKGQNWGSGPKEFLQHLYEQKSNYQNFFNDMLEPLFYEALATERADHFYQRFNSKIPFLNGGLFEPIRAYDWVNTDILLDNDIFKDIFEVFDLYNFTVREDEPLDKEVAVDPEMLGKVFENLIPENERKGSGTYYTPREIVHYMCQESLINYLETKIAGNSISRSDIEALVHEGDTAIEHNRTAESKNLEKGSYTKDYKPKLPESIRNNAKVIDDALAHIKICDPAIGSGAFPVGMMNEIVRVRCALTPFINEPDRTLYDFKRHAIQESIYGVDIETSAVDIAKLRLWLSLVVDEDDFGTIKPLPNLEYKIRVGNSLLQVERNLFNNHLFEDLEKQKALYFDETSPSKKANLKTKIDNLINELTGQSEVFDFEIYFSEVFRENGGFDVVIGNPPYVSIEKFSGTPEQRIWKKIYSVFSARGDLYCLFYEKGINLLKSEGGLCYITSNKYFRAGYGKKLRQYLVEKCLPKVIVDFGELPIFDATAYPSVFIGGKKQKFQNSYATCVSIENISDIRNLSETIKANGIDILINDFTDDTWVFDKPDFLDLLHKLKKSGSTLSQMLKLKGKKIYSGIKTGFNDAFVIDEKTKEELIATDPRSKELIKPWLRGKDIKRWVIKPTNLYLICIPKGFHLNLKQYFAIHNHLSKYETKLRARGQCEGLPNKPGTRQHHWLELDNNPADGYIELFGEPKIIVPDLSPSPRFYLDREQFLLDMTAFFIPLGDYFLVGLLNSKLIEFFFIRITSSVRGATLRFKKQYMDQIPLPIVSEEDQEKITVLVKEILSNPTSPNVPKLESQINQLVYQFYGLTDEEIAIVEGRKQ
ncbi:MAG: TaqI-like C-terminal specificity domain-containing protein [Candidatus Margulisiibacteriota bacterium]